MKKIISLLMAVLMLLCLAACTTRNTTLNLEAYKEEGNLTPAEIEKKLDEGKNSLSEFEKRVLLDSEIPATIELRDNETYKIEIPFEYESVAFTFDQQGIARIYDGNAEISPVKSGTAILHIDIDDTFMYHVKIIVDLAQIQAEDSYTGYEAKTVDADLIERELEVYASAYDDLVIQNDLSSGEMVISDSFETENETPGYAAKYKLLTSIDYLKMNGYHRIQVVVEPTASGYNCKFYAEK